jgi:C4-dicarboxylate-specific signal transduction histidine kinase
MKGHFLIIGVLILIVSIIISLNIFFQQSLQGEMAEEFNKQQLLIADSIANNISNQMLLLREQTAAAAERLGREPQLLYPRAKKIFETIINEAGSLELSVAVITVSGDVFFSHGDEKNIKRIVLQLMQKASALRDHAASLIESDPSVVFVAPVTYRTTRIGYVLFISTMSGIADHHIKKLSDLGKGNIYLLDSSGTLVFHPAQRSMIGKNINRTEDSCTKCHLSFNLWQEIVRGTYGLHGRFVAPSGEDRMIAFSKPTMASSWIVFVSAPVSEITATTRQSMMFYSYLIIAILITTITVSTALIYFNRKRVQAEEVEHYARELEEKVKQRTMELSNEKEKLNTIVRAIGSGLMMLDAKGVVLWTNDYLTKMAGKSVVGSTCEQLCDDCSVSGAHEENSIETVIMTDMFGKKGHYFQVTTAPIRDEQNTLVGYIRLIHDVTEIRRMEERMSNSEKLASFGRLAAGIAHEIGNPLTSVFSFVQILQEIEDDEFKKDSLKTISFHINRISETLKQLSGFSKMPTCETRACSINDVVEASLNLIQYDKRARNVEIVRDLAVDLPEVSADGNQLSQVFVNLILNALDAMPEGGRLIVSSRVVHEGVKISFADTGVGIPSEDLRRIFDPFYTTKEKGTGLGLSVSYAIVEKMQGTITVQSELGKGTIFEICLPAKRSS